MLNRYLKEITDSPQVLNRYLIEIWSLPERAPCPFLTNLRQAVSSHAAREMIGFQFCLGHLAESGNLRSVRKAGEFIVGLEKCT